MLNNLDNTLNKLFDTINITDNDNNNNNQLDKYGVIYSIKLFYKENRKISITIISILIFILYFLLNLP